MIDHLQKSTDEKDAGFTLVELLVVVVIIGILAAIAVPMFLNQKDKAVGAGIKSDLRSIATLQESYFVDTGSYTNDTTKLDRFTTSKDNVITVTVSADPQGYCLKGTNPRADDDMYYDSTAGGLLAAGETC